MGLSPNTYQNSWVGWLVGIMVFNTTFNYISVISWRSVLLVEETAYCCIEYTSPWAGFKLKTLVVIGTDCMGNGKYNYHVIKATTPQQPQSSWVSVCYIWQGSPLPISLIVIIKLINYWNDNNCNKAYHIYSKSLAACHCQFTVKPV